jgi:nitrile hydratase subunit beta
VNGVHDMGGMHGFGPVRVEKDEPVFHAAWEGRVYAMMQALIRRRVFNVDEMRRAIESIPPAQYLASTYYERWLAALRMLLEEKGLLTPAEIETAIGQIATEPARAGRLARRDNPDLADSVLRQYRRPARAPQGAASSRFRIGDRVVAKNCHVKGHTRLPGYVRGKQGIIQHVHGVFDLPDTRAHGGEGNPQPVYSVCFAAQDLWGEAAGRDHVYIDLWESYLDPVKWRTAP